MVIIHCKFKEDNYLIITNNTNMTNRITKIVFQYCTTQNINPAAIANPTIHQMAVFMRSFASSSAFRLASSSAFCLAHSRACSSANFSALRRASSCALRAASSRALRSASSFCFNAFFQFQ